MTTLCTFITFIIYILYIAKRVKQYTLRPTSEWVLKCSESSNFCHLTDIFLNVAVTYGCLMWCIYHRSTKTLKLCALEKYLFIYSYIVV